MLENNIDIAERQLTRQQIEQAEQLASKIFERINKNKK